MEKFMTRFEMSGVGTDVTVQEINSAEFGFILRLYDEFEGGELAEQELDGVLTRNQDGVWKLSDDAKVSLSDRDVQNLGAAIENDYLHS